MRSLAFSPSVAAHLRLPSILLATAATTALLALLPTAGASAAGTPTITLPPTGEVESVLGKTPLGPIAAGKLAEALSQLHGFEGVETAKLKEALEKAIAELQAGGGTLEGLLHGEGAAKLEAALSEVLGHLGPTLKELLGTNPRAKIEEALGSDAVTEVLGKLLSGSSEPQVLLEQILHGLNPETLQSLLGSVLKGEPVSKATVEQLAHELGTTVAALDAQFGKTPEQLPGTATALTTPLANGETLGVLNAAKGVTLGVIRNTSETLGATGGNGAPGSNGSSGSSGSNGAPGATVTVTTSTPSPTGSVAGLKSGKLRVVSRKVNRRSATIVLEVPSAGRLAASGRGIHSISRETSQAERVTIHPALTKAGTASLRRHHRKLTVPVRITFKAVDGPSSSASVQLTYK